MLRPFVLACFLASLLLSCREPYTPGPVAAPGSYLVVEGAIDPGTDSTIIKLSKTVTLSSKNAFNPVIGASVTVQNNQNTNAIPLTGDGHGNYIAVGLNLSPALQYRLAITTSDGSYQSDFVPVKRTPPIDSVGYLLTGGGLQLYVNTHDPANNTTFYMWQYQETWIFHSEYESSIIADTITHTIRSRNPNEEVSRCFGNDASSVILINSTQHLGKDVVYRSPLTLIPLSSEKLEDKYSILVKQYALTAGAYAFYLNLKNNSEQLGSIFDALPSQINGNIHNVSNSTVPVVGYLTISNAQTKRIFISNDALPVVPTVYPYSCQLEGVTFDQVPTVFFTKPYDFVPISEIADGYTFSSTVCADCTVRGTTQTPSFWK
jgi:hypothetical protein